MTDIEIENKIIRMIESCKTYTHLKNTKRYIELRYNNDWPQIIQMKYDMKCGQGIW